MKLSLCLMVRCLLYDPPSAESNLELICVQRAESWLTRLVKSETIWRSQVKMRRLERHTRSEIMVRRTNFLIVISIAAIFAAAPVFSQSTSLIAAGKKEGKTVVYGSLESDTADAAFNAFKKKTGIEVDYWRASATKVMDRALSEYRAGKPLFDIILTNDNPMQIMVKEGIFAKYDSPSAKDFTKESIDPNLGPRYRNAVIGVVYNKSSLSAADTPKTLEDLVKPQYRGKIV